MERILDKIPGMETKGTRDNQAGPVRGYHVAWPGMEKRTHEGEA